MSDTKDPTSTCSEEATLSFEERLANARRRLEKVDAAADRAARPLLQKQLTQWQAEDDDE